jgi:hypothetical protein
VAANPAKHIELGGTNRRERETGLADFIRQARSRPVIFPKAHLSSTTPVTMSRVALHRRNLARRVVGLVGRLRRPV